MSTNGSFSIYNSNVVAINHPLPNHCQVTVPALGNALLTLPPDGLPKYLSTILLPEVGDRRLIALSSDKTEVFWV